MAKLDIRDCKFKTIVGWRGDSIVCPQAFGGDLFAGCSFRCFFCFCREMEEELYNKYYTGWTPDLVRPCDPDDYRKLFDKAFGTDKKSNNWFVRCLRQGLPFNMGSKAETFCLEDQKENVVVKVLELFREYNVPIIFETKTHYIGLQKYRDIIKDLNCAVIVAIMGGSDTLNWKLEPGLPTASMRWALVEELNNLGIWTAVRWEPILVGINSSKDDFENYAKQAQKSNCKHVSFFNYRTSNYKRAQIEFESRGYDYIKLLERNLAENWEPVGRRFIKTMKEYDIPVSSPDIINFPFDSDRISCCGTDELFVPYQFNFQYALSIIKSKGYVCWSDMEEIGFREDKSYERMKMLWNGSKKGYYSIAECRGIKILDVDSNGFNIYRAEEIPVYHKMKKGLVL